MSFQHTVLDRFLRYVRIDTQSDPFSDTCPSTEKQKDLGRVLVAELQELGLSDAHMDEHGYVYATLPGNVEKDVPVICFCSHMDTAPDCSGTDVKPIVHANYQGQDIVLPDDPSQVIRRADHPELAHKIGHDIITASGATLLGADNKAGVAAIMDAVTQMVRHPEIPHGKIRILFTPDEEIGRGVDKVDMEKLGAQFGYTMDGERVGSLEDETFSADSADLVIHGVSVHPGFAKDKLVNAIKIAGEVLAALPTDRLSPETTSGREGFIHPVHVHGNGEKATIQFILRDFTREGLAQHAVFLEDLVKSVMTRHPRASYDLTVKEQYRNMKEVLDLHPQVADYAQQAIERAGLEVHRSSIRGGTDGSRLSFMGLPCPNIFAGEHAFHSKQEWATRQDMEKAVETIIHLSTIWAENA
ncbi:MAG: peptidase T [Lewinellaceae bacterium]|nr:peptidase T [Saprospiraceae bacterium]MCB9311161.1 peptidase T [Lewinellaceae bacterium]HRW75176.1 peptidase T [Saprospiraceae bacterium]